MNTYFSLSICLMLLVGHSSLYKNNVLETNSTAGPIKEVTTTWIQGNWKVYQAEQGQKALFNRDAFRFFEDETGFKGVNQRLTWEFHGNILEIRLLKNGKTVNTYWWTSRNRDNNLVLTRYILLSKDGIKSIERVKFVLERIKN